MALFPKLEPVLANERGNILTLAAAAMPVLIGSAGLAIDTIQLSLTKRHLQRAADSAALAGAYARVQSKDVSAAVLDVVEANSGVALSRRPTITEPTSGSHAGRAVRVALRATRSVPFLSFITGSEPALAAEATAALVYTGKYCMIALDESTGTSITFSGNSTVDLSCGVISNSSGPQAVYADGSADVTASPVAAVGAVPSSRAYNQPTLLLPYSLPQRDPFAQLANPTPPLCKAGVSLSNQRDSLDLTPGCYRGMNIHGTVNLAPGTYYVTGPEFTLNSGAKMTGAGVTIIFTSETPSTQSTYPQITINGNAQLELTAPSSGTFAGIVMAYDPRKSGGSYFINGNSSSAFEGAFYFPHQHLTFNGNSEMETNCIQLVAFKITFTGNTHINNECPSDGGAKAFDASWVRLVS